MSSNNNSNSDASTVNSRAHGNTAMRIPPHTSISSIWSSTRTMLQCPNCDVIKDRYKYLNNHIQRGINEDFLLTCARCGHRSCTGIAYSQHPCVKQGYVQRPKEIKQAAKLELKNANKCTSGLQMGNLEPEELWRGLTDEEQEEMFVNNQIYESPVMKDGDGDYDMEEKVIDRVAMLDWSKQTNLDDFSAPGSRSLPGFVTPWGPYTLQAPVNFSPTNFPTHLPFTSTPTQAYDHDISSLYRARLSYFASSSSNATSSACGGLAHGTTAQYPLRHSRASITQCRRELMADGPIAAQRNANPPLGAQTTADTPYYESLRSRSIQNAGANDTAPSGSRMASSSYTNVTSRDIFHTRFDDAGNETAENGAE